MSKTPQDFYNQYNGKRIDYDGSYGVQCVDGFKVFCNWAGVPVKSTGNNYASGYWIYRNSNGYSKYFDFITDKSKVRRGDWCIWNNGSSCESSHIAMYWSPYGSGKATFFGQRQGGNREFRLTRLPTDFMGAFRWKGFTSASGKSIDQIARECIDGKWGNGANRKRRLEAAGYNYKEVQRRVNELLR